MWKKNVNNIFGQKHILTEISEVTGISKISDFSLNFSKFMSLKKFYLLHAFYHEIRLNVF